MAISSGSVRFGWRLRMRGPNVVIEMQTPRPAFVQPQGTAASIGTLERWTAVAAANRARSRDDN